MAEELILLPGSFSQNTGQVPEVVPDKFPSLLKSVFPKILFYYIYILSNKCIFLVLL